RRHSPAAPDQGRGLEAGVRRAVTPQRLEGHERGAVGQQEEPLLSYGRTQHVAAELLEPIPILAPYGHASVQIEVLTPSLEGARRLDPRSVGVRPEPLDACPGAGPEGDATLYGRACESRECGRSAANGSPASAAPASPGRTSIRATRRAIVSASRATSVSLGAGRRWKRSVPSAPVAKCVRASLPRPLQRACRRHWDSLR